MTRTILLVDDDEGYLLAAKRLLEGAGHHVRTACGADEARQQLQSKIPDLILLDVIMPAEDGFTFAEELSQSKTLESVPVILVTAVADSPGHTMHAFEEGKGLTAADVLPKSEVPERLLDSVSSVLGQE